MNALSSMQSQQSAAVRTAPRIALFGASGAIGKSVATALRAAGRAYRVVGRSAAALRQQFGDDPLAEIVAWDTDDAASMRAAARGIDTVIYLVGVDYWKFELHPVLMQKALDAAIAENVRHFVLSGTVYPYGLPGTAKVREGHPRQPHTFKGKMRKQQEDLLMAADSAGKIRGTVLRLPDFYGPGVDKSLVDSVFQAAVSGKRAMMIGPIDTPHEFVYVPDAGPALLALAANAQAYGRIWHFAGAGVISQRQFADRVFAQAGGKPRLMVFNRWMVRLLGLFDQFMRELVEMHYLQTAPVLLDDSDLRKLLPGLVKTSYDEGIRQTLAAMRV
ncbi:NAD-dependent epimerase/dehydratase family protein [Undibacterium sp.]|jgi:nucleoside-diphosphate-sugar epimerase|uniref:NAD-dependent epimerase/dehydratase family protein n=1 Tax=Undibacterium sp. TaxID=1914977 RepID=UPI002C6AED6A|nr:NAD-dependent epimerase/dehydratase family protein [Undibacterium sp.]HTD06889.1 NAD-dependent epimerase/dehydratase family protein [Undibacterium sp.]